MNPKSMENMLSRLFLWNNQRLDLRCKLLERILNLKLERLTDELWNNARHAKYFP